LFADAGNIWLARKTEAYPDGEFTFSKLGPDLAINVGTGARLDIAGLFLVRADVGIPVKRPDYKPETDINGTIIRSGWAFDDMFAYKGWYKENLVLTIGIGYPF
jgi:hypothetical protein